MTSIVMAMWTGCVSSCDRDPGCGSGCDWMLDRGGEEANESESERKKESESGSVTMRVVCLRWSLLLVPLRVERRAALRLHSCQTSQRAERLTVDQRGGRTSSSGQRGMRRHARRRCEHTSHA